MMTSQSVTRPFIVSLLLIPAVFVAVDALAGQEGASSLVKALFILTMGVEVLALYQVVGARRLFSRSDPMYLVWTLILAFMIVRLLAQSRLASITFGVVPRYSEGGPVLLFVYVVVCRYVYTVSDLLFVTALVTAVRTYKSTGLSFRLLRRDYLYFLVLWAIPALTLAYRSNLELGGVFTSDRHVVAYRLTAVFVGALIASLCVVIRRYALQMGGGAIARIWTTVVVAGIARALSFMVLALMLRWWRLGAQFIEQYLLWIFAGCWLLAALYQRELLPRAFEASPAAIGAREFASKKEADGVEVLR